MAKFFQFIFFIGKGFDASFYHFLAWQMPDTRIYCASSQKWETLPDRPIAIGWTQSFCSFSELLSLFLTVRSQCCLLCAICQHGLEIETFSFLHWDLHPFFNLRHKQPNLTARWIAVYLCLLSSSNTHFFKSISLLSFYKTKHHCLFLLFLHYYSTILRTFCSRFL